MTAVPTTTALRRFLALAAFAQGTAGARDAQDLLDDLLLAHSLAGQGVGEDLVPWLESAAEAIRDALAGPQPMTLPRVMVERLGLLADGLEQQMSLATPAQRLRAEVQLVMRRRGWVFPQGDG
jgi:hypothetical protein